MSEFTDTFMNLNTNVLEDLDNIEVSSSIEDSSSSMEDKISSIDDKTSMEDEIKKFKETDFGLEDRTEIDNILQDRKKLATRLEEDPKFDKMYKKAEHRYFKQYDQTGDSASSDVDEDDPTYLEAKSIVDRLHNRTKYTDSSFKNPDPDFSEPVKENSKKSSKETPKKTPKSPKTPKETLEEKDLYDLERYGKVSDEPIPTSRQDKVIYIKRVETLNLTINYH